MRLERSELQALVSVIESGGFQRAADQLGLSQSAVSQSIAGLESKLDTLLIERGRTPGLSRTGQRVFDYAVQTLSSERELLQDVEVLRQGLRPPLNIAVSSFIAEYFTAGLLMTNATERPGLAVNVRAMPSREIINAVLSGQVELGFGPFQTHMQTFETVPLMQTRHSLVIGRKHPHCKAILAGDEAALAASCLIASYLDEPEDRPGQQRIRDYFQTVWQVSSLPLRIELIGRGQGVGFLNAPVIRDQSKEHGLVEVSSAAFSNFDRTVGIFYQRQHNLSVSAQEFIQHCQQKWPADLSS